MYRTKKPVMKVWIGNFFPGSEMYRETAACTVGKSLINQTATLEETVQNRRALKGHMNLYGLEAIRRVKKLVKAKLGLEAELVFSDKAGCGMCPCSPGFMIKVTLPREKAELFRDLFSKYSFRSLSHSWRDSKGNYRTTWGVRDTGLHMWGEVKRGKVLITAGSEDTTAKAFKAMRGVLKEN